MTLYPSVTRLGDEETGGSGDQTLSPHLRVTPSPCLSLLGFLMVCVLAATSTKLGKLQPVGRGLLILRCYVVAALAYTTLEHNVIARHNSPYLKRTLFFVLRALFI